MLTKFLVIIRDLAAGAALTDAYNLYNNPSAKPFSWLIVLLIGIAVLLIGSGTALVLIRRQKIRQVK